MIVGEPKNKLKILDWYCHQGHQYEFFKTGHDFYLCGPGGKIPRWNENHRPRNQNVNFITESQALSMNFDIVMVRSPISARKYRNLVKKGATPIAVVQTTTYFPVMDEVKHVVWNSHEVMKKNKHAYRRKHHHHIVHGYDPGEFVKLDLEKNGRILTVANVFKKRGRIMGYPLWTKFDKAFDMCDIIGHGNKDISEDIRCADTMEELINFYNTYSIYFNPTIHSAMPRSRAEAAMCGMPIVTTDNYDISSYFKHKRDGIISNNISEMNSGIESILSSEQLREEYGERAREIAIKHFHIKDYIEHWNHLFSIL
jgi:glycosyltransferase involved in cell wall biosynthesis